MSINIKVDSERMSSLVTIDEYLALLDGDVKAMVNVLSQFVLGDNGSYLDKVAGRKIIGKLTLDEMKEAIGAFTERAENIAVPPSNGAV
jgi:hypothetical protein